MIQDVTNNDAFEPEILEYLALKQGNKVAQLTIGGTNVDLYSASQETWESLLLIRTGSAEHNIKLSMRALKMGMKLMHSGLVKDGKIVAATEKDEKKNRLLNGCVSLELKFIPQTQTQKKRLPVYPPKSSIIKRKNQIAAPSVTTIIGNQIAQLILLGFSSSSFLEPIQIPPN